MRKYTQPVTINTIARYKHDCAQCEFLGRYIEWDLYACVKRSKVAGRSKLENVVARKSEDPADYLSGWVAAFTELDGENPLVMALGLALKSEKFKIPDDIKLRAWDYYVAPTLELYVS
jgi:hypothetical protein